MTEKNQYTTEAAGTAVVNSLKVPGAVFPKAGSLEYQPAIRSTLVCTAHNRSGSDCKRVAAPGKSVCYYHGGADRTGAPVGNQNARKHGYYSKHVPPELQERVSEALDIPGLDHEIALMRALIDEAVNEGADLPTICLGITTLRHLIEARRWHLGPA